MKPRNLSSELANAGDERISSAGYAFRESDEYWRLDKNTTVAVHSVRAILSPETASGFTRTLSLYARDKSPAHTKSICERFKHFLVTTGTSTVTTTALMNYRASLEPATEWYVATFRGFLKKWHALGYPGLTDDVIALLKEWRLKGNVKGDVVKRLDPHGGPLSDLELQAFNEGAVHAFEKGLITLQQFAMAVCVSHTGRRSIQISHLRLKDVVEGTTQNGDAMYLLNVPRAKQRGTRFREAFTQFRMTSELWTLLKMQAAQVAMEVQDALGFRLQDVDLMELPLFPDIKAVARVSSPIELRSLLGSDKLHRKSYLVTSTVKKIASAARIYSERTGSIIELVARRFRYTTGTRAAREGFGEMVIAELLDHSTTQNAGVYIKNIPDHVAALDKAVGLQLAPYAQAFAGVLVDSERDARRGDDVNSRVHAGGEGVGTCGSYGFCGANVPIPCYTCMHFQPWLDGPHESILATLTAERDRVFSMTGDALVAGATDRAILAVVDVIQRCAQRKEELGRG